MFFASILLIIYNELSVDVPMKAWSKVDVIGMLLVLFGVICLLFSKSSLLAALVLLCAAVMLLYSIYNAKYDAVRFRDMLCHYQAILSSSKNGWIAWNINNDYIGSSKVKSMLGIKHVGDLKITDVLAAIDQCDATELSVNFNKLKKTGDAFSMVVVSNYRSYKIEISGARMLVDNVDTLVLWMVNVTEATSALELLKGKLSEVRAGRKLLYNVLDSLPIPVWKRDDSLNLNYCNATYASYLGMSIDQVLCENAQLVAGSLFGQGRSLAENVKKSNRAASIAQFVVVDGRRKKLVIHEMPCDNGEMVGFALDVTEEENLTQNLDRVVTANCEVLETISTAIAIFGENMRLSFFNSAYQKMMKLEENWLHSKPSYSEILDECRDNRQLPEYADFQAFKKDQFALFTSVTSPIQQLLHLPNGNTLRLVIAPYPLGGLLFMYEDVTDSLDLQRRNSTLLAVQKETMDHLYEGVMVFGSDNRLKIINNSMLKMWKLEDYPVSELKGIHLADMLSRIKDALDYGSDWQAFQENAISNLTDRIAKTGKLCKKDGAVIMFSYIPLPDGAHMHSFIDITDTCVVEDAVREKNQALKSAQKLRFEFVSGISTELKDPLNILIGFSGLLLQQYYGALNAKQLEYCKYILDASNQLNQLINNLLDMVSIDLDSAKLDMSEFELQSAVREVISSVEKRAHEKNVDITMDFVEQSIAFNGDKTRLKQALFNILINAIQFTPPDSKVDVKVLVDDSRVKILVRDEGMGRIKKEKKKVFSRSGSVNFLNADVKNVSLPLVRSLIEQQGGALSISSDIENGTCVVCSFPKQTQEISLQEMKEVVNL